MPLTYPATGLDDPAGLVDLLGTFWGRTYAGRDQLRAYADGLGRAYARVHADVRAAADCLAWATVPAYRRPEWVRATLRRSAVEARSAPVAYGAGDPYGDTVSYGATRPVVDYPTPIVGYAAIPAIHDHIVTPAVTLLDGLDYALEAGRVVLRADPFADPRWARRPVFDAAGAVVDEEVDCWLFRPAVDIGYVATHWGYVLGLDHAAGADRALVVGLLDALAAGAAAGRVDAILAAVTGVPLAAGGETVAAVGADARGPLVLTDRAAYRLPAGSTPVVAAGRALAAGDALGDALRVIEPNRGGAAVPVLALGPGVLAGRYHGDLVFEDRDLPLQVTRDPYGRTRVACALGGFPADVEAFWDEVHRRGVAAGRTLAEALDVRAAPTGQPTAASLPPTFNPLRFLLDHVLRGGVALVRLRAAALPPAAGLAALRLLRRVTPIHTLLLFLVDLPPLADAAAAADPAEPISTYVAMPPIMEADEPTPATDGPHPARIVSRTCQ